MNQPNFFIRLLVTFGIIEIKEIEKEKPKQKFVSDRDPITAPLREQQRRSRLIYNVIIVISVLIFLSVLVFWYMQINSNESNEKPSENTVIPESVTPDPHGSEREIRAFWQKQVQVMSCMELKRMIELEESTAESNSYMFATWEYTNNDRLFPSPREGCYKETGYLNDALDDCEDYGAFVNCDKYVFPREETSNGCLIHFPKDWFYIDLASENKMYDDPNQYLDQIYGGNCIGVKDQ